MTKTQAQVTPLPPLPPLDAVPYDQIPPLDVAGMVRVVWHGKWVILVAMAFAIICGGYYAFRMKQPQFAATATLQIDAQPAHLSDVSQHWPNPATDLASLNTEVTTLTSDRILARVITDLDLINDPEFNRYLTPASAFSLNTLRGRLRQMITGVTETPPDRAAIAQKTVQNLRGRLSATRPADTYIFRITARSGDAEKAARIANSAANAYIGAQVDAKDATAERAIAWLTQRVATLRAQLEQQERAVTDLIGTVQIQEDTGLDTLSAAVLAVDEERAQAASSLATIAALTNASPRQTAEAAQLTDRIAEIDARRARLHGQLTAQSNGLGALQQMQREAEATRVLYRSFLARLQETQVQRGLEYPDSRLVAPATTGYYTGPRKTLILVVATVVGGLFGLMLVAIGHMTRTGVLHPEDLRIQTGRPVLAQVPGQPRHAGRFRQMLLAGGSHPLSPAVRKIKAGLIVDAGGRLPQVILCTATTSGEGTATLAMAMARGMGAADGKVLLVHAAPDSRAGLAFFPTLTGRTADNAFEDPLFDPALGCDLLGLQDLETVIDAGFAGKLADLRKRYVHIVILAPPVAASPETLLLAGHADAIVYAVRWVKTPVDAVLHGLQMITQASDAPLGQVLTKTHPRKMRRFAASSGSPFAALELA